MSNLFRNMAAVSMKTAKRFQQLSAQVQADCIFTDDQGLKNFIYRTQRVK